MERRTFFQATAVALAVSNVALAADSQQMEFYELRTYSLKKARRTLLDDYLSQAFIPALKRLKIGPVGVFFEESVDDESRVYVFIVHPTAESCLMLSARLAADPQYQQQADVYLSAKAADPVYSRIESSLLVPIQGMPRLVSVDAKKPRIFQLRTYESHNERANKKKIQMFNEGEIAIFKRVGLTPMFFGETVAGGAMPNLTYLLVFPDDQALKSAWDAFRTDSEWLKLRAIPEYADREIVSKITNRVLKPAPYSEL